MSGAPAGECLPPIPHLHVRADPCRTTGPGHAPAVLSGPPPSALEVFRGWPRFPAEMKQLACNGALESPRWRDPRTEEVEVLPVVPGDVCAPGIRSFRQGRSRGCPAVVIRGRDVVLGLVDGSCGGCHAGQACLRSVCPVRPAACLAMERNSHTGGPSQPVRHLCWLGGLGRGPWPGSGEDRVAADWAAPCAQGTGTASALSGRRLPASRPTLAAAPISAPPPCRTHLPSGRLAGFLSACGGVVRKASGAGRQFVPAASGSLPPGAVPAGRGGQPDACVRSLRGRPQARPAPVRHGRGDADPSCLYRPSRTFMARCDGRLRVARAPGDGPKPKVHPARRHSGVHLLLLSAAQGAVPLPSSCDRWATAPRDTSVVGPPETTSPAFPASV